MATTDPYDINESRRTGLSVALGQPSVTGRGASPAAAPLPTGKPPAPAPMQTPDQMMADPSKILSSKDAGQLSAASQQMALRGAQEETAAKNLEAQNAVTQEKTRGEYLKTINDEKDVATKQHQQDLQEASPFAPTPESKADLGSLFGLLTAATFASGGEGRYAGMQALAGLTGAMKGYQAGQKDVFNRDIKKFEENLKALKTHNEKVDKIYKDAMDLYATNKDMANQKIRELIAADNTGVIAMLGRSHQISKIGEVIDAQAKALTHAQELVDKRNNEWGMLRARQKFDAEQAQKRYTRDVELAKVKASEKNVKAELPIIQGIRSIEKLQTQLRDPEVQVGLKAKTAPLLEKVFSLENKTEFPLGDKTPFEQVVNSTLTGTDKTTVFLKDALLATYEIERAAKGGQRLTVQDMKMIGPVLDPTNYKPETYNQILEDRRRVLYDNAQDIGMTAADVKSRFAQRPYEPFGSSASASVPSAAGELTQAEKDELAALKAKHGRQ